MAWFSHYVNFWWPGCHGTRKELCKSSESSNERLGLIDMVNLVFFSKYVKVGGDILNDGWTAALR